MFFGVLSLVLLHMLNSLLLGTAITFGVCIKAPFTIDMAFWMKLVFGSILTGEIFATISYHFLVHRSRLLTRTNGNSSYRVQGLVRLW